MATPAELNRRVKKLEAALKPFAEEADQWSESVGNHYRPGVTEPKKTVSYGKAVFSIGDLRRARKLLAE